MDDEIMRILIATDNHLGYLEKDAIRGNDSFASFEEVLATGQRMKVDMILFAGDMFHENKPSRHATFVSMELLRKYCLGDSAVFTEVLSEQSDIFKSSQGMVNYENPYQAVSLPIYAIHGNHDDPSRECGQNSDALCALDLLAVSNLLNYFGKADQVDDVEITPILIRKGTTHIALYGLGAVRDERLNRMWNMKKVKFVRPSIDQGRDNFFNIFLLHQNRDYGRGSKNCIHESMIPEWMDLVIWGNEHEAIPKLVESLVGTYRIFQPGSTVCTSLVEGESASHPKGMGFLEVRNTKEFRMKSIPLKQIRPFVYREVSLSEFPPHVLRPTDLNVEAKIQQLLQQIVDEMITEARVLSEEVATASVTANISSSASSNSRLATSNRTLSGQQLPKYVIKKPEQVLIRLKVDHAGYPTIHPQRFGALFVGQVANPNDIIIFARKKTIGANPRVRGPADGGDLLSRMIEDGQDDIHKIRIEDLVAETLTSSNKQLSLLPDSEMAQALEDFVVRRFPNAITDTVEEALEHVQRELFQDVAVQNRIGASSGAGASMDTSVNKSVIVEATAKVRQIAEEKVKQGQRAFPGAVPKRRTVAPSIDADSGDEGMNPNMDDDDEDNGGAKRGSSSGRGGAGASVGARGGRGSRGRGASASGAVSGRASVTMETAAPTRGRGSRGGRTSTRGAKSSSSAASKKRGRESDDDDDNVNAKSDGDEFNEMSNDEALFNNAASKSKGRGKTAAKSSAKSGTANTTKRATKRKHIESEDESEESEFVANDSEKDDDDNFDEDLQQSSEDSEKHVKKNKPSKKASTPSSSCTGRIAGRIDASTTSKASQLSQKKANQAASASSSSRSNQAIVIDDDIEDEPVRATARSQAGSTVSSRSSDPIAVNSQTLTLSQTNKLAQSKLKFGSAAGANTVSDSSGGLSAGATTGSKLTQSKKNVLTSGW